MRLILKRILKNPLFTTTVAICILLLSFLFYSIIVYKNLKEEVIATLNEVSQQTAEALRNQINSDQRAIEDIAIMISADQRQMDEVLESLRKVSVNHRLLRMGIIAPDGSAITTDQKTLDLASRPYFQAALKGESSVSDRLIDFVDGRAIAVYAAPVYDTAEKNVVAVLFGTYSIEEYQSSLSVNLFGGRGYTYIVKKNGDAISASTSSPGQTAFDNVFLVLKEASSENDQVITDLKQGMINEKLGFIKCIDKANQGYKYMYYRPLGINDWYLLTVVPMEVLNQKILFILSYTLILGSIIVATSYLIFMNMLKIQKKATAILEEMVFVNKLTGHRSYEKFKIDAKDILSKKHHTDQYALISIDVDKFKYINDMFGYNEGDRLICFIESVFLSDCKNNELVAHISADDFVLLLKFDTRENLCSRLRKFKESIGEYKRPQGKNYEISMAIGVYEIDNIQIDIDSMKDRADIPRKQTKNNKNISYAFYDEAVRTRILQDRELENSMNTALEQNEFVVMYQPKFWVKDGSLAGAEALIRWKRRDGSLLNPDIFIPLFEENGFIISLDKYVFNQMCSDIHRWIKQGYRVMPISSNLSRKNIVIKDLPDEYDAIANSYGIPKELIALELTETAFIENESIIGKFVQNIRNRGISVIMDDFGTGFSSLNLLLSIDIDTLKIDRSLVNSIDTNAKSHAVLDMAIQLMHQWNVTVNAEGVETAEQYKCLKQLNCDEVQGYHLARPLSVTEFEKLMKKF